MSLKEKIDGNTIINSKNNLDVYKVLEKTTTFTEYPKTKTGLIDFYQTELHNENIRFENFTFIVNINALFEIKYSLVDYLKIILLPLYHCQWDSEMKSIIQDVINNKTNVNVISFAERLITKKLTIDMVPEDWRYLVEDLINDKGLDITTFKTLKELEDYVDSNVIYASTTPEDSYFTPEPPKEAILVEEERKMIAQTFRLDPDEFTTKSEAMKLYEYRNRK